MSPQLIIFFNLITSVLDFVLIFVRKNSVLVTLGSYRVKYGAA